MIEISNNLRYLFKDMKHLLQEDRIEEFLEQVHVDDIPNATKILIEAGYDKYRCRVANSRFAYGIHDKMLDYLYWNKQDTKEHVLLIRKYFHKKFRYNDNSIQLHYTISFYLDGKEYSLLNKIIDKVENEDYCIQSDVARDIIDNYLNS